MKGRTGGRWVAGAGLVVMLCLAVWAREQKISWEDVPDAVKATILKQAKGAKILEVEKNVRRSGRTTYEAEFMLDGQMVEINVNANGTLRSVRYGDDDDDDRHGGSQIPFENMPEPVQAALTSLAGKGRVTKAIREKDRTGNLFLATWEADGKKLGVKLTEQGMVVEMREYLADDAVPGLIRAASLQAFRKGTKTRFVRRKLVMYEVQAEVGGRHRKVLIGPSGRILARR